MIVNNFAEVALRLKTLGAEVDLISFDIFDTLLERHVDPPDAVKLLAAQRTAAIFSTGGKVVTPEALLAARNLSETALRRKAQDAGFDPECAFTDIAGEVAHSLAPGKEETLFSALVEGELAAEREALYPKAGVIELLSALKKQGFRIVAISDMYLDGSLILRLFRYFGLDQLVDCIYVSSDLKLGKYSGRLFRHVLETEGVAPERLVHVGDHPHSDFATPRSMGICALHLFDSANLQRRQTIRTLYWLGERNVFWRGEHLLALIPPGVAGNFHYRYGYDQLAPIFCGFMLGLLEELRRSAIDKVFYLAREGDLFRLLHDKLAPLIAADAPPAEYLYVSRKAVFLPASWRGLSRRYLDAVLCNPRQKGLFSVANALGIPPEVFTGVARRFDLDGVTQPIHGWSTAKFARLIADEEFQKIIIHHATPARQLLRRYLDQEGFFGKQRVALVDIGWNGTIQCALQETFREEQDFPETTGFYLSFNDGLKYGLDQEEAKGILYDCRTSPITHNVFALFEELFENSARALHGTTIGYRETVSGLMVPELRSDDASDRCAERAYDDRAMDLRRGILDFADAFAKAVRLTAYVFDDIKPAILAHAERCVVYPSPEETERLLEIVHTEDLGSDSVMSFSEYHLPGPTILLRPKRFLRLLRTSNWKYGTARTLRLPGTNYFLRRIELLVAQLKLKAVRIPPPRPRLVELMLVALVKRGAFPLLNRLRKLLPR